MLDHLGFTASWIRPVERNNIGIKIAHAFDLKNTRVPTRETHCAFVFIVELFFKVLNIEDQTIVGPFRRAFGFDRLVTRAHINLVVVFLAVRVLFKATWQRVGLNRLCRGFDQIIHRSFPQQYDCRPKRRHRVFCDWHGPPTKGAAHGR